MWFRTAEELLSPLSMGKIVTDKVRKRTGNGVPNETTGARGKSETD
jgi:hypothetical protein